MFRYIAISWNPRSEEQTAVARKWLARLRTGQWQLATQSDSSGLSVFCADLRGQAHSIYPLPDNRGAIVGKLFTRYSAGARAQPIATITRSHLAEIEKHGAKFLARNFWGRYIAFWTAADGNFAFRDPSGTYPCFVVAHQGVRVCFSWLQDCLDITGLEPTIDWKYISALLPNTILQTTATALTEVTEILQGHALNLQRPTSPAVECWNPFSIAADDPLEDAQTAGHALRDATRHCVQAWAACYAGILLRMSGGIDSSIVLSCLRDAPSKPRLTGLTHYCQGTHFDERPYARIAAQSVPLPLIECEQPTQVELAKILPTAPWPVPMSCVSAVQSDRLEANIAAQHGADGIFSGGGGDQIFYQCNLALAPADFISSHGLRWRALALCLDAARAGRTSLWYVLRDVLRQGLGGRSWDPSSEVGYARYLLPKEVVEAARLAPNARHPWFAQPSATSPGKTFHIYTLATPASYYDLRGHADDAEFVHPLWSQPLIEVALRIPTYVLASNGWDRALARRAFAADLPPQIRNRRTKGALDHYMKDILRQNLPFVRELLLDGSLVREGLIDRAGLEEVLSGRPSTVASPVSEIFDYVSAEAWLQRWSVRRQAVAA